MHWAGPAFFSFAFVAMWCAHLFGLAPQWDAGDAETMKNIMIAVSAFWIGSAASSTRKTELQGAADAKLADKPSS